MLRILISIDSATISHVVKMSAYLNQVAGGEATFLTVVRNDAERSRAEALLNRAIASLKTVERQPQTRIRIGHAVDEIAREAEAGQYNLIVLGERPPAISMLKTDIERVASRSSCPVLVARGQINPLKRMLICEAGKNPPVMVRLINQLAPLVKAFPELTILHVMSQIAAAPNILGWELEADAAALIEKHTREGQLLEQDLQTLQQLSVKLEPKVRHGRVVNEILAETRSGNYDLLVIGAHKAEGWDRFLLDDLAHAIITHADRPVLMV